MCRKVNFWSALSHGKLLLQENPRTLTYLPYFFKNFKRKHRLFFFCLLEAQIFLPNTDCFHQVQDYVNQSFFNHLPMVLSGSFRLGFRILILPSSPPVMMKSSLTAKQVQGQGLL